MNKSYTEKYLIKDLSNKAFKKKYCAGRPKKRAFFKYGWSTTGVNDSNRKEWQRVILRQNPWMEDNLFYNSLEAQHLRSIGQEIRE